VLPAPKSLRCPEGQVVVTALPRQALTSHSLAMLQHGRGCPVCHGGGRQDRTCCAACRKRCSMTEENIARSLLMAMVNKGWPEVDAWVELLDQGNRGGRFLQRMHMRNKGRTRKWLERQYALQAHFVAANPSGDAQHTCYELVNYAAVVNSGLGCSSGAAGVTERAVLKALTDRALALMHPLVRVSVRTLSQECDISLPTVSEALKRLTRHGWIELQASGVGMQPATYRLLTRDKTCTEDSVLPGGDGNPVQVVSQAPHHLFGPKGVGRGAAETHALLPVLRRDLRRGSLIMSNRCVPKAFKHTEALLRAARLLGPVPRQGSTLADLHSAHPGNVNLRTVRRRLHDLCRAGLAFRDADGLWWRYLTDVDGLAQYLRIPDTRWEKEARYTRERLNYWDHLLSPEGSRNRPRDLVRLVEGTEFVYGVVDSNGCVKELDRRVMTEAEAADHRELRDEASGSA